MRREDRSKTMKGSPICSTECGMSQQRKSDGGGYRSTVSTRDYGHVKVKQSVKHQ